MNHTPEEREIQKKTFNPGIPNKIYSQGMKTRDFWEEISEDSEKKNSSLNATDFYTGDRFALFIDMRRIDDCSKRNRTATGVKKIYQKNDRFLGFFWEDFWKDFRIFWKDFLLNFIIKLETLFKNLTLANFIFFIFI